MTSHTDCTVITTQEALCMYSNSLEVELHIALHCGTLVLWNEELWTEGVDGFVHWRWFIPLARLVHLNKLPVGWSSIATECYHLKATAFQTSYHIPHYWNSCTPDAVVVVNWAYGYSMLVNNPRIMKSSTCVATVSGLNVVQLSHASLNACSWLLKSLKLTNLAHVFVVN